MQILVLIGLYFLKCTKFDQLILGKIIKIAATRCQILWLKCTKFDFGWGFAPDPAYSTPQDPLAGFKGPTYKGRGGEGRGMGGEGKGRGGEGRGGDGGEGRRVDARPVCLLVLTILATSLAV